jgi:Ras-related protein Rab-21
MAVRVPPACSKRGRRYDFLSCFVYTSSSIKLNTVIARDNKVEMSGAGAQPVEIKVCVIGDSDVGKSTLTKRYVDGISPDNITPTIGASYLQKRLMVDGVDMSLQIWDTAGQERFKSMTPMYYRAAQAAICVFDVTNEESFHRIGSWLKVLKVHANPNVVVFIAGNKCDKEATFDLDLAKQYAESVGAGYLPTSALRGDNVDSIFGKMAMEVVRVYREKGIIQEAKPSDLVKLQAKSKERGKGGGCC